MSEKRTCPGCDSHTSSVHRAWLDGEPCPYCDDDLTRLPTPPCPTCGRPLAADSRPVVGEAAITDEAVEAAAEAEWKLSYADTRPWSMATQDLADEYRNAARVALTAALPHMGDGKADA